MEYNERIRQYRTQKNITQQQLADDIGVSRQSVVRWEKGFTVPSMYYAQQLAEYFGVTVTELMTGSAEANDQKSDCGMSVNHKLVALRFCIAVAAIVIGYLLCRGLVLTVRYWYIQTGRDGGTLRVAAGTAFYIIDGLGAVAFFASLAIWISRLVAWLNSTDNKYLRYRLYRLWEIGLAVWLIGVIAVALETYAHNLVLFTLCIAVAAAAIIVYGFDFVFKRAYGKKMVVPHNKAIEIVNLIYFVIGLAMIVALVVWIIYVTNKLPIHGLEILFALLYAGIAAVVVVVTYIAVRVTLHIIIVRHNKEE